MIFIADFPPPVHGMANVNLAIFKIMKAQADVDVFKVDTSPPLPSKYFQTVCWLLCKALFLPLLIIKLLFGLIILKHRVVYRAINGGSGQIFDLFFIAVSRVFGVRIFIHHHSFNYLSKQSRLFALLNIVAGDQCVHIVLGEEMKKALSSRYGVDSSNIRIISNLAFMDQVDGLAFEVQDEKIRIGHLANLCEEKGVDVYLSVCEQLVDNLDFETVLAGPFATESSKLLYKKNKHNVTYHGPLYGDEKKEFFRSLNVFLFPSKYINEAEPLVLYEAAQYGGLLIGTERGCMKSVIDGFNGITLHEGDDLVCRIIEKIQEESFDQYFSKESVNCRVDLFNLKVRENKLMLGKVINEIATS